MNRIKHFLRLGLKQLVKWKLGIRFARYSKDGTKEKCPLCKVEHMNQEHVSTCDLICPSKGADALKFKEACLQLLTFQQEVDIEDDQLQEQDGGTLKKLLEADYLVAQRVQTVYDD